MFGWNKLFVSICVARSYFPIPRVSYYKSGMNQTSNVETTAEKQKPNQQIGDGDNKVQKHDP